MGLRSGWAASPETFWVGSPAEILPPEPAPDVGRVELRESAAEEAYLLLASAGAAEALGAFWIYGTEPIPELPVVLWWADWAEDAAERSVSDLLRRQAEQHVADFAAGSVTENIPVPPPEAPDLGRWADDETAAERAHRILEDAGAAQAAAGFHAGSAEPVPYLPVVPFWPLEEDLKVEGASVRALGQAAAEALAWFQAYGTEPLAEVPVVIWFAAEDDFSAEIAAWESLRLGGARSLPDHWASPAETLPPEPPAVPDYVPQELLEGRAPGPAEIPEPWAGPPVPAEALPVTPWWTDVDELAVEAWARHVLERGWSEQQFDSFFYGDRGLVSLVPAVPHGTPVGATGATGRTDAAGTAGVPPAVVTGRTGVE